MHPTSVIVLSEASRMLAPCQEVQNHESVITIVFPCREREGGKWREGWAER
jgi:hypothetical protein